MIFSDELGRLASSEFTTLRPMQADVLSQYERLLPAVGASPPRDVAVEMPAGTGKTLVALLIANHHLAEGLKVAVLTGTKQLARQVKADADLLRVPSTVFEGAGNTWDARDVNRYRRAQTIAIMNYWAYINSKPRLIPADILILDDAHLAENAISGLFSVRIKRDDDRALFNQLIEVIRSLRPGRYSVIDSITYGTPTREPLLLPFTDWLSTAARVGDLLDEAREETTNDSIRYTWPRIRTHIDALALYVTPYELLIRPMVYPMAAVPALDTPAQRLYLSATVGDPGDLQRRTGCGDLTVIRPARPQPSERGRRMIVLLPPGGSPSQDLLRGGLELLWPVARKRLWLCSSWRDVARSKSLLPEQSRSWELRGDDEGVLDEFRNARAGHLFLAARYDGIDFPHDDCRLAIITSSPVTADAQEEFYSEYLRDASFLKSRFSQRVAQALGRCNRGPGDFAVYAFTDSRFVDRFGGSDPDYLSYLPADMQAEIEAALDETADGFSECCRRATAFLSGEFGDWDAHVASVGQNLRTLPAPASSAAASQHEVLAWQALWDGDPVRAEVRFRRAQEAYQTMEARGPVAICQYCRAWARYLCAVRQSDPSGRNDAVGLLRTAAEVGPSSWFTSILRASARDIDVADAPRPTTAVQQDDYQGSVLQAWERTLLEEGLREATLTRWLERVQQHLTADRHDEVREALNDLGRLCGFEGVRPRDSGMPDVIWMHSGDPRIVITWEIKAELQPGRAIALQDVNQAHGQGRWARENHENRGYRCTSLLVCRETRFEAEVVDRLDNVRCMSQVGLAALATSVIEVFNEFRAVWRANNSASRREAADRVRTRIPRGDWLLNLCSSHRDVIEPNDMAGAWAGSRAALASQAGETE